MSSDNTVIKFLDKAAVENSVGKGEDLGPFSSLQVSMRLISDDSATAGVILLQHSAVDEDIYYQDIGTAWDVYGSPTNEFQTISNFLRFVRYKVENATAGKHPTISLYVVAKE